MGGGIRGSRIRDLYWREVYPRVNDARLIVIQKATGLSSRQAGTSSTGKAVPHRQ
jgi:hypothetical protein